MGRRALLGGILRLEAHGHAVDAIAQAGGRRAIGKHMTEMAAAARAVDLGTYHAVAGILAGEEGAGQGIEEARPPGPALELGAGVEQRLAASGAYEGAETL